MTTATNIVLGALDRFRDYLKSDDSMKYEREFANPVLDAVDKCLAEPNMRTTEVLIKIAGAGGLGQARADPFRDSIRDLVEMALAAASVDRLLRRFEADFEAVQVHR